MHGLHHSITFRKILSIDLGKFNSVVCPYDPATTQHSFLTVQTTPQAMHDLLAQHAGDDPSQTLVVFETCDCGGWVYDIAAAMTSNNQMRLRIERAANEACRRMSE